MVTFRSIGKGIGTVGGGIIGGTVKVAGKVVRKKYQDTGEWLVEIGDSVQSSSKNVLDSAGQFVDGSIQETYGLIKKDDYYKKQGWENLKDSTTRSLKGIGSALKYTAKNTGLVYTGFRKGDNQQVVDGLKNIGKVVVVSGLAIGVVDILDGSDIGAAEELDTKNSSLANLEHPETGVPFVEKEVVLPDGQAVEGVFPVFDSSFSVIIAEDYYLESDSVQFQLANDTFYQAIQEEPNLIREIGLTQSDVIALANGETPEGFTWHHQENPGTLQLVDEEVHENTGHTGGRSIWGGGSEYR